MTVSSGSAPRRACIMGHPVGHSRSPMLHGYWLRTLALKGAYEFADVAPEDFEAFFHGLSAHGFVGGNITKPHKEQAFRLVGKHRPSVVLGVGGYSSGPVLLAAAIRGGPLRAHAAATEALRQPGEDLSVAYFRSFQSEHGDAHRPCYCLSNWVSEATLPQLAVLSASSFAKAVLPMLRGSAAIPSA